MRQSAPKCRFNAPKLDTFWTPGFCHPVAVEVEVEVEVVEQSDVVEQSAVEVEVEVERRTRERPAGSKFPPAFAFQHRCITPAPLWIGFHRKFFTAILWTASSPLMLSRIAFASASKVATIRSASTGTWALPHVT